MNPSFEFNFFEILLNSKITIDINVEYKTIAKIPPKTVEFSNQKLVIEFHRKNEMKL